MVRRACLLSLVMVLALCNAGDNARLHFLKPISRVVLSPPQGVTVAVSTYVPPHKENRWWVLQWDGDQCGGSSIHELHGEDSPAEQPERINDQPFTVRMGPGICALAVTIVGPRDQVLARAELTVRVCGGLSECQ